MQVSPLSCNFVSLSTKYLSKYLGGGIYIIIPINLFLSLFSWHVSTLKGHLQRVTKWRKKGQWPHSNSKITEWQTFTYVTVHSPTLPSLYPPHSSFSNPSVALPTSQLILQPFRCSSYVTAHSRTILSLFLRHRLFTYVTWRAAHESKRHGQDMQHVLSNAEMCTRL